MLRPVASTRYIIKQDMAATGCFNSHRHQTPINNTYATGRVKKMACCKTELSSVKSLNCVGGTRPIPHHDIFILWQMNPALWSVELSLVDCGPAYFNPHSDDHFSRYINNANNKMVDGSDGKIVGHHTPRLGTNAAKGSEYFLHRLI
ncbi:hypothetical protein NL676_003948 [Syzygium grande]|nr:hypothetical protein NL676_003948 [Syzygium grande]